MPEQLQIERQAIDADAMSEASTNCVACSIANSPLNKVVRRTSGISDSKRADIAALAINLASASSWSDTILPHISRSLENDLDPVSMRAQITGHFSDETLSHPIDLEPPPEYSPYHERDLTPDSDSSPSDSMRESHSKPEMSQWNDSGYGFRESNHRYGADAPLLAESNGKSGQWGLDGAVMKRHPGKRKGRICAAILLLILVTLNLIMYGSYHIVRRNRSPQANLPLMPTDKNHVQHTTCDHIKGRFELHERLELSTTTGNIDIEIDPQLDPVEVFTPSELILTSTTGSINLRISDSWWCRKNKTFPIIHTQIKTVTGSISAKILLGLTGLANISSVSGSQDLRLFVYGSSSHGLISHLSTTSHIGDQVVAVTNWGGQDARIENLRAEHRSLGTANIDLQYSDDWRGRVHAKANAIGRVEVQESRGLVFDQEGEHEVIAHKGEGKYLNTVNVITEGTGAIVFKSWYTW